MENCDGRNHGQKKTKKQKKNPKKTLERNPEAKCMVCTWLKNPGYTTAKAVAA